VITLKVFAICFSYPKAIAKAVASSTVAAPMSVITSAADLLSKPFAVNLAYSSSATDVLSTLTALVLDIPNVSDACPPISDNTSVADLPSTDVPSIRRKSLSAAPLVNTATLPLLMPVSVTAAVPSPNDVRAVESDSATKLEPLPTIKLPLVTASPATSCYCTCKLCSNDTFIR
jgi:hypothetical protein